MVIHTFYGLLICALVLPRARARRRNWWISHWCRGLVALLNVRLVTHGKLPGTDTARTMFVANHISWLDIHAINSVHAVRFVAKAEIRGWPVFGWIAEKVNTLFIERTRRHDTGRMVNMATESLRAGDCLCFFPEGTTSDGNHLLAFKGSLIQAAVNAEALVWPVAIRYPRADGSANGDMAYYGDMSLGQSMKRVLRQRAAVVELHFLPPIASAGQDRHSLSRLARQAIAQALKLPA